MPEYHAPWWLRGGHLETVAPVLFPPIVPPYPSERRVVEVAAGSSVELHLSTPERPRGGTVVAIHGLTGSAEGAHVRSLAAEALGRGWHAARLNLRTHGGTAALSASLYHAAQSDDIGAVCRALEAWGLPRPYAVIGISISGNQVLRYGATAGDGSAADAIVALNPPVDLFRVEREIDRLSNRVYRASYVRGLCRMLDEIRAVRHVDGPPANPRRLRTIRAFDAVFVAPDGGYASVDAYYADASAGPLLHGLRTPALVLSAENDPFIPPEMLRAHAGAGGHLELRLPSRGGHAGYLSGPSRRGLRFWAAVPVMDWLDGQRATR
ncbi:MAG: alpha/beta fold hydrolase [Dehalococcoidia bacterium]|nr:alpha/beta fold hydrolase [Dehalococcoidia bacterium]